VLPGDAASGYFARWKAREQGELAEIRASFPLPILTAPLHPGEVIGVDALRRLGEELYGDRDPAEIFARGRPIRLVRRASRTRLEIDLPGVSKEEVSVGVRGSDLVVRVRDAERLIALPASVAGLAVGSVRLRGGVLEVAFAP
jgi:arsenite-transporting ATPase